MTEDTSDLDKLLRGKPKLGAGSSSLVARQNQSRELDAFLSEQDPARALALWLTQTGFDHGVRDRRLHTYLSQVIVALDQLIAEQINAILHHPKFQRLESSWRGMVYLVDEASKSSNVRIRLLDIKWREIAKDIERASDFDQSALFNLIYSQEFGMPGGQPFGALIGDFYVSHKRSDRHREDDIATLRGLSQIAAASFAPFICGCSPELFGLDDFSILGNPINFDSLFQNTEYIAWRNLRQTDDARFLGVTLPRVLMREPYKNYQLGKGSLFFNENVEFRDSSRYLWGNACYAFGAILIREFGEVGWFSHIRGAPRDHIGGGLVTAFPALDFGIDSEAVAQKIVTEVVISDNKERQLSDLGFLSLCDCYDTPFAAFQSCPSIQQPKAYSSKAVTANARMSAMLQQVLCASRFAHYIKVMVRDKVGSFTTDNDCERMLQSWLNKYTSGRNDLEWESLSRYPLQSARVQVRELPGKPGTFSSIIHLKPHYTVDQIVSELRLATELSQIGFGKI